MIKEPLNADELHWLAKIGNIKIRDLVNIKSQAFKKLQPDLNAMNEEDIVALIDSEPRIIRRPLLTRGDKVLIGFDGEAYQGLLS